MIGTVFSNFFLHPRSPEPTAPPSYVTFDAPTPTSLMVRWRSIPRAHRNGVMLGYRVQYHRVNDNNTINILNVSVETTVIFIDKLGENLNYSVAVTGYNSIGESPKSDDIIRAGKKGMSVYEMCFLLCLFTSDNSSWWSSTLDL